MRQIAEGISQVIKQVGQQPQTTSGGLTKFSMESTDAVRAEILMIVGEVENSKEIHLTDAERVALTLDLQRTGFDLEEIRKMAEAVKRNNTFGKLSVDVWINAVELFTRPEAYLLAQKIIDRRKAAMLAMNITEDQIAAAGLEEVQYEYNRKLGTLKDGIIGKLRARCKAVESFIRQCDDATREEILEIAVNKKLVVRDEFWRDILPMLAPQLLNEVEPMIRRM